MSDPFIGQTIGGFQIVRRLGRGGMGLVFEAEEVALRGRRVALKILPLEFAIESRAVARFRREAEIAASLDHPNIVPVYAVGEEAGRYYYAMKYIRGCSLAQVIAAATSLRPEVAATQLGGSDQDETIDAQEYPDAARFLYAEEEAEFSTESSQSQKEPSTIVKRRFQRAAEIIAQAAEGLQYAHQRKIIHRDIKPGNLMIDENGIVLIADFGLATDIRSQTLTLSGSLVGTPSYMSPEQVTTARAIIDHRTDIYSLGATLYELLALRPPFEAETREKLLRQIVMKEPKPLRAQDRRMPFDLETIVLKALEKDVNRRYQSAREMADDLNRYLRNIPIAARPPTLIDKTIKFTRRKKAQVSIGAVAAAVFIMILGIILMAQTSGKSAKVRDLLGKARRAESQKRYEEALDFYDRVLGLDPSHIEAVRESSRLKADIPRLRAEEASEERRRQARGMAKEGKALMTSYFDLRSLLDERQRKVKEMSEQFRAYEPIEDKRRLWRSQDELKDTHRAVSETFSNVIGKFTEALSLDPENQIAQMGLTDLYWQRFTEAEREGKEDEMAYFRKLIETHDRENRYAEKLKGDGAIAITSAPTGAEVYLYEYVEKDRILTPSNERTLGVTPASKQSLAMGSYLLVLKKEGFRDVRYPVLIERQEDEKVNIKMCTDEEIGKDFIYVPAGDFVMGGGEKMLGSVEKHKEYVAGFFIAKFEVTCGEYLEFLNDLAERAPDEAAKRVPRRAPSTGYYWKKGKDGKYEREVTDGNYVWVWGLRDPISNISWLDANAYLKWKSGQDGVEYRLPTDTEWEKAARGADGRTYPWGYQFDPTFCKMQLSSHAKDPEEIGRYEKDESPYGVRDMAGSTSEWCADSEADDHRLRRGGAWCLGEAYCRSSTRSFAADYTVGTVTGFRAARSAP